MNLFQHESHTHLCKPTVAIEYFHCLATELKERKSTNGVIKPGTKWSQEFTEVKMSP